ncbi:hypothetical protein B0H17DRAFT_1149639 [Mycena rosella]|uniref:Uncharacterized protein n=1 Tax=Mycena rosella TaxID=1033263 RepID=A0AAD7C296_MYCRO|nr:hypothetical protein B0H17DRAFT_1149639 [Mycena rosella]
MAMSRQTQSPKNIYTFEKYCSQGREESTEAATLRGIARLPGKMLAKDIPACEMIFKIWARTKPNSYTGNKIVTIKWAKSSHQRSLKYDSIAGPHYYTKESLKGVVPLLRIQLAKAFKVKRNTVQNTCYDAQECLTRHHYQIEQRGCRPEEVDVAPTNAFSNVSLHIPMLLLALHVLYGPDGQDHWPDAQSSYMHQRWQPVMVAACYIESDWEAAGGRDGTDRVWGRAARDSGAVSGGWRQERASNTCHNGDSVYGIGTNMARELPYLAHVIGAKSQ